MASPFPNSGSAAIEEKADFENDHDYWDAEISASRQMLKDWHKEGNRAVARYKDERTGTGNDISKEKTATFRLNLFHNNVKTINCMMYGNLPTVEVSRRFQDANDDVARVAAEVMERALNNDISDHGADYDAVLRSCLQDRLLPGLGAAKVRYEVEFEQQEIPAVIGIDGSVVQPAETVEKVTHEDAPVDYFYWNDILWNWARNWSEVRWLGFRTYMRKEEVKIRFPDIDADKLTYERRAVRDDEDAPLEPEEDAAWLMAEIWEIWDKDELKVKYWHEHYEQMLEVVDDPLELQAFFPTPPFFIANATTQMYVPVPDYTLNKNLYNEIDILSTRIAIITTAVKVVGVYDQSATGVERMMKEGTENSMIPVENWAMFGEKGGLDGVIDWFPVEEIASVLLKLRDLRQEYIQLLHQTTGMSDIVRGTLDNQYEGNAQTEKKAQYASVRIQALQDEFARFASDMMQIKAEIMARHFEPETIARMANMEHSMDVDLLPQAIELIKNPDVARLRIEIRPESVAMVDFAQLQQERTSYLTALSTFMQSSVGMVEKVPGSLPFLMQLLKWGLAGFKGAAEIEGQIDKAIEAAMEAEKKRQEQPPPPNPEEIKAQMAQALEQLKHQNKMQQEQMENQNEMQQRQQDYQLDVQTFMADSQASMQTANAEHQFTLEQIAAKMNADIEVSIADAETNAGQQAAVAETEIRKDAAKTTNEIITMGEEHELDMELETHKANLRPEPESKSDGDKK